MGKVLTDYPRNQLCSLMEVAAVNAIASLYMTVEMHLVIAERARGNKKWLPHRALEISQLDLEVWCSETLPDAPSILGNVAGISV